MMMRTLLMCLCLITTGCNSANKKQAVRTVPTIQILTSTGMKRFELELAKTNSEREVGLMNRASLPPNKGMLFFFEKEDIVAFWMKNTHIPLDLVFFDKDWFVVGVLENLTPLSLESRSINRPSRYVLEINAGLIKKENIALGNKAVFVDKE